MDRHHVRAPTLLPATCADATCADATCADDTCADATCADACPYPVHVEGDEDLVHVAGCVLVHSLQVQDGLELEERDEAGGRLLHELVVPVVHVLRQDVV